jgi:hypothetical protein
MTLIIVMLIACCSILEPVGAQELSSQDLPVDIDSLFNGDETQEESPEDVQEEATQLPLLSRLQESDQLLVGGNFRFIAGYSLGLTEMIGAVGDYLPLSIVGISSGINLTFAISPVLEISNKFSFTYPDYQLKIAEMAMEYDIWNQAYLTLGLKRINWGRSPNFSFVNIIHRQADTPLGEVDPQKTLIGRLVIPIGVGGVEVLLQNKNEYQENDLSISGERLGIGAKYNFAQERIDIAIGGYYQRGLNGRMFVTGSTTITDWMEVYAEGVFVESTLRQDDTGPYAGEEEPTTLSGDPIKDGWVEIAPGIVRYDNNPDFGACIGVIVGLFENTLELNGEYYYNGEETENQVSGARFPLFWGHNMAFNVDYTIPHTPLRLRMGYRYNSTFDSSFFLPRLTIDVIRHVTVDVGGGLFWGPDDAGYRANNPDELDRPAFLTFTMTFHGKL